jgi:hypothetical protein
MSKEFEFLPELQRAIAKNPSVFAADPTTAPEILVELAAPDRLDHIRQLVAQNPNTPPQSLWKLAIDFPYEVANNPVFMLMQLEYPQLVANMDSSILVEMLEQHDELPEVWIDGVMYHHDGEVIETLLKNPKLTEIQLKQICTMWKDSESIMIRLLCHPSCSDTWKHEIARLTDGNAPTAVAEYCLKYTQELPIELLKTLIDHAPILILERLALSSRMTNELLDYLFTPEHHLLQYFLSKRFQNETWKLSEAVQLRLAQNQIAEFEIRLNIQKELAANRLTSPKVLEILSRDDDSIVRDLALRSLASLKLTELEYSDMSDS